LAGAFADRLVLFGAGPLGKATLAGLRRAAQEPLAFADNDRRLWGRRIDGIVVLPPDEAARLYAHCACFVVTIYNGSSARKQLARLGCHTVVPFTPLFWKYGEFFVPASCVELPETLRDRVMEVEICHSILHDDHSRDELLGQLSWRYWLDESGLPPAGDARDTYFPFDLLRPIADEVFLDCGSFDGQTIRSFHAHWQGNFRHVLAFEPDPANRRLLKRHVRELGISEQVSVLPYAVGGESHPVRFTSTASVTSHVGGEGNLLVECRRLDDIDWPLAPTYIKMDIEGAELEALAGARELLRHGRPVLAICTYHRGPHLWQIPNLIHSISSEYRIFLRRYAEECWEGVCYAIPASRLKDPGFRYA
jgi:FkbM family methyltransferase